MNSYDQARESGLLMNYQAVPASAKIKRQPTWKKSKSLIWPIPIILTVCILIFYVILSSDDANNPPDNNTDLPIMLSAAPLSPQNPPYTYTLNAGKLKVMGHEFIDTKRPLFSFDSLPSSSAITELDMRNVFLDCTDMTKYIAPFAENLKKIHLDRLWIRDGHLKRMPMPNLDYFFFNEYRNEKTGFYKTKKLLKSILFFDLPQTWDYDKDLLKLNMSRIHISFDDTNIIDIVPNEITLNIHDCNDVLVGQDLSQITSLALFHCDNLEPTTLPIGSTALKKLVLNNSPPNSPVYDFLTTFPNLEELHLFQWFPIQSSMDLSLLSNLQKLKKFSIGRIPIQPPSSQLSLPSLQEVSFEVNYNAQLCENLAHIFPSVTSYAFYNVSQLSGAGIETLLKNSMENERNGVTEILIMGYSGASPTLNSMVHNYTAAHVVDPDIPDFIIKAQNKNVFYLEKMTSFEGSYLRYVRMGWSDFESYRDYVSWDKYT